MNALLAFIRLFRLPNLAIVFLTQMLPYWYVLRPAILQGRGVPALTWNSFLLVACATVLTTLGGYILNDYFDRQMDAINKPGRVVWGKYLPASGALIMYAIVLTAVHIMAFLLDIELHPANHWPLWLYPSVSFLLFLYAWQLKCTAIIGNFIVSLLCGIVPIILVFPEERALWLSSFQEPELIQKATGLVWFYGLFAFITNLLREQIKDLEDFPGDSACGCTTLAVVKGPRFAKKPAAFTALTVSLMIGLLLYFWAETDAPSWQIIAGGVMLLLPALSTTWLIYSARTVNGFRWASLLVKIIMFAGIFLLLRCWPNDLLQAIHAYVGK
jgi:4-hydroxybenzoate polyprenyltransferase